MGDCFINRCVTIYPNNRYVTEYLQGTMSDLTTNTSTITFGQCENLENVKASLCTTVSSSAFSYDRNLKMITLDSCSNICSYAFSNCSSLSRVYLPGSTICSLGSSTAFYDTNYGAYNSLVAAIYVPSSLVSSYKTAYGWSYFSSNIVAIEDEFGFRSSVNYAVPENSSYTWALLIASSYLSLYATYGLQSTSKTKSFFSRGYLHGPNSISTMISSSCFYECGLRGVEFRSVTGIGEMAFGDCSYLGSVSFPNCTNLFTRAFYNCKALVSVDFPNVLNVWSSAFKGCTNLETINLPKCSSFYDGVFDGTKFLADKLLTKGYLDYSNETGNYFLKYYDDYWSSTAFSGDHTKICQNAFRSTNIQSVTFSNCSYIDGGAFESCSSLVYASFPNCLSYSYFAFTPGAMTNSTLQYINLNKCKSLSSFSNFTALSSIDAIGCTSVYGSAFAYCLSLASINFPNCTHIGFSAFQGCTSLSSVNIPNCTYIGSSAFQGCTSLSSVNIPNCSEIRADAFLNCINLSYIQINACRLISDYAFYRCTLREFNAPNCAIVGSSAFMSCYYLQAVSLSACSIYMSAFYNCSALSKVYLHGASVRILANSMVFSKTKITSTSGNIFVNYNLVNTYKSANNWSYFSRIISAIFTPSRCDSLTITADDVKGKATTTTIHYSAYCYGKKSDGTYGYETLTGDATSDSFSKNPSTTQSRQVTVSYTFLSTTATTTITQGPYKAKEYSLTLSGITTYGFEKDLSVLALDQNVYDGPYKSNNYNKDSSKAVVKIDVDVDDAQELTVWINSYAEGAYDYTVAGAIDASTYPTSNTSNAYAGNGYSTSASSSSGKYSNTKSYQKNPSSGLSETYWRKIVYSLTDGAHTIYITYLKDSSTYANNDRGYFVIER